MRMLLRISFAITVAALLPAVVASAVPVENESFGIVPDPEQVEGLDRGTFAIPLEDGAIFEDAVRVYNRTDQPIELVVYAADARAGVDGSISVDLRGSRPEGVGAWIELSQEELHLLPRGESIVKFRITVGSTSPMPDFGAIVVENTARGVRSDLPQRLHVVVRTSPAESPTTSRRVRPLLLRSPWIIVAILGLVAAAVLVWLGARRARRPHDAITAPGELTARPAEPAAAPEGSRPILHRLGLEAAAASPSRRRSGAAPKEAAPTHVLSETGKRPDERPLLDLPADEEDDDTGGQELGELEANADDAHEDEDDDIGDEGPPEPLVRKPLTHEPAPPPERMKRARSREAAPLSPSAQKLGYIPLDEL